MGSHIGGGGGHPGGNPCGSGQPIGGAHPCGGGQPGGENPPGGPHGGGQSPGPFRVPDPLRLRVRRVDPGVMTSIMLLHLVGADQQMKTAADHFEAPQRPTFQIWD